MYNSSPEGDNISAPAVSKTHTENVAYENNMAGFKPVPD